MPITRSTLTASAARSFCSRRPAMLRSSWASCSRLRSSWTAAAGAPRARSSQILPLKKALEEPEKQIIQHTLESCGWNRQAAASLLKVNRTTLYMKMKKYGLELPPGVTDAEDGAK